MPLGGATQVGSNEYSRPSNRASDHGLPLLCGRSEPVMNAAAGREDGHVATFRVSAQLPEAMDMACAKRRLGRRACGGERALEASAIGPHRADQSGWLTKSRGTLHSGSVT